MFRRTGMCVWVIGLAFVARPLWAATQGPTAAIASGSITHVTGNEGISSPYTLEFDVSVGESALNMSAVVGQTLNVTTPGGQVIAGIVGSIEQVATNGRANSYHVRVVPQLSRLLYRSSSRTFEEKSALEIVRSVLSDAGVKVLDVGVRSAIPKRPITTQYRETDLAFISRLLESEGIHYHFEVSASAETLVLGDDNRAFALLGNVALATEAGAIRELRVGQALTSGRVDVGDYSWERPQSDMSGTASARAFTELDERVFPAKVEDPVTARTLAKVRLEARQSEAQVCNGTSANARLRPGYRFTLAGNARPGGYQEFVVTSVEHRSGASGYENTFTCVPMSVPFRPSLKTQAPRITGIVSAVVVGPTGETKHLDKYGRVRVRFPWRSRSESSTTQAGDAGWVRVAQLGAGGNEGATSLWSPDVGDEVAVAFDHGDPDRPVVIGSLYNAGAMPPVDLPGSKHVSVFRNKSKAGLVSDLTYDNTPSSESLVLHSGDQKIMLDRTGLYIVGQGKSLVFANDAVLIESAGQRVLLDRRKDEVRLEAGGQSLVIGKSGITASSPISAPGQTRPVTPASSPTIAPGQTRPLATTPSPTSAAVPARAASTAPSAVSAPAARPAPATPFLAPPRTRGKN